MTDRAKLLTNVLEQIAQGVVMFDSSRHLVVWNSQYERILQFPENFLKVGMPNQDLTLFLAKRGDLGPGDPEMLARQRLELLWSKRTGLAEITVRGGNTYQVSVNPADDDGLVATYTDITASKNAARNFRESEERLSLSLKSAGLGTFSWNIKEGTHFWDDRNQEIWGFEPGSYSGDVETDFRNNLHPEDADHVWDKINNALSNKGNYDLEYRIIKPDGSIAHLHAAAILLRDEDGNSEKFIGVSRDITDRKQSEEAVRISEEMFRTAFETSAAGMALHDLAGGYLKVNQRFCEILGYTEPEFLKMNWRDVTHPDDIAATEALDVETVSGVRDNFVTEKRYVHKDGHNVWALVYSAHPRDADGDPKYILGQINDISALKQTEKELQDNREIMAALADNLPEFITLKDMDGRFVFVNKRFEEWVDLDRENVIGKTVHDIYSKEQATEFSASDQKALAEQKIFSHEVDLSYPDGKTRTVISTRFPLVSVSGDPIGLGTVNVDISDHKLIEEALRESEERLKAQVETLQEREELLKSQTIELLHLAEERSAARDQLQILNDQKDIFFSIIAHDLREPFNALLGFSSLLSNRQTSLGQREVMEYGAAVHTSAHQVHKLLENLLEWSLLQMGRLEFEPGSIDLKDIIDTNLDLFRPVAGNKKIRLTSSRRQPLEAFADARMISTIVRNLVNNAIKFTPGGGAVTIGARRKGKRAEVEVSDTGIGIAPDRLSKLFRLDEKSSAVGTGGETGTGLGLHLCKDLIDKNGGQISIESIEGQGSTFRFTLPLTS